MLMMAVIIVIIMEIRARKPAGDYYYYYWSMMVVDDGDGDDDDAELELLPRVYPMSTTTTTILQFESGCGSQNCLSTGLPIDSTQHRLH